VFLPAAWIPEPKNNTNCVLLQRLRFLWVETDENASYWFPPTHVAMDFGRVEAFVCEMSSTFVATLAAEFSRRS